MLLYPGEFVLPQTKWFYLIRSSDMEMFTVSFQAGAIFTYHTANAAWNLYAADTLLRMIVVNEDDGTICIRNDSNERWAVYDQNMSDPSPKFVALFEPYEHKCYRVCEWMGAFKLHPSWAPMCLYEDTPLFTITQHIVAKKDMSIWSEDTVMYLPKGIYANADELMDVLNRYNPCHGARGGNLCYFSLSRRGHITATAHHRKIEPSRLVFVPHVEFLGFQLNKEYTLPLRTNAVIRGEHPLKFV